MKKIFIAPEAQVMDVTAESIIATSMTGGDTGTVDINPDPVDPTVPGAFTPAAREDNGGSSVWNEW